MWRRLCIQRRFARVFETRKRWEKYLKPHEAIVLTSLVSKTSQEKTLITKKTKTTQKQRQLILTTGPRPRLFYVDFNKSSNKYSGSSNKGEIVLDPMVCF